MVFDAILSGKCEWSEIVGCDAKARYAILRKSVLIV